MHAAYARLARCRRRRQELVEPGSRHRLSRRDGALALSRTGQQLDGTIAIGDQTNGVERAEQDGAVA